MTVTSLSPTLMQRLLLIYSYQSNVLIVTDLKLLPVQCSDCHQYKVITNIMHWSSPVYSNHQFIAVGRLQSLQIYFLLTGNHFFAGTLLELSSPGVTSSINLYAQACISDTQNCGLTHSTTDLCVTHLYWTQMQWNLLYMLYLLHTCTCCNDWFREKKSWHESVSFPCFPCDIQLKHFEDSCF